MKKITQKAILLLLLGGALCQAQESPDVKKNLLAARLQLLQGSKTYNPEEGIAAYKQLANLGNAEAMNALGLIYNKGISVAVNEQEGIQWLEKAAIAGYAKAWYNLGVLLKDADNPMDQAKALSYFEKAAKTGYTKAYHGWGGMVMKGKGTSQNYPLALSIFKEGADKADPSATYSVGYMYYKGLGCTQDYSLALQQFELGAQKGSLSAMYMLGLCYRNGYGVAIDTEKAKYWLNKSAKKGLKKSEIELDTPEAENAQPKKVKTISQPIPDVITITETEVPETFQKIKQAPITTNISGNYTGYLLRYDWSGQNIISKTPLQIDLTQEATQLVGQWKEEAGDSVTFNAQIQEDAIVFEDSKIDRTEHFYKDTVASYQFKEAKLQLLQTDESLFIVGNLALYNIKEREYERPMYLILDKKQQKSSENEELFSSVVVHPNPVLSDFNLSFDLARDVDATMSIYYITGRELYREQWNGLTAGKQTKTLALNAPPGYYILRLTYGAEVKTTILIKK
ncbi:T9SS type A sorting domain-containing protein [Flavobacterium sp. W22_SRS_FK3]|uniref:T9SS type A sorting domain-containing protein n=1 Tax=Flavobacterium sp. W22_SRS_FK3 TaxID=3240275 RepID=UPI003F8FDFBD